MAIDRNILVSLHGNRLGLNTAGDLIADGRIMALNAGSPARRVTWFDDFLGDTINAGYALLEGTDSATSDFAISTGVGGTAILTTGDSATHTMAGNGISVDLGALFWKASNGGLTFETRIQLDVITNVAYFVGFTDQVTPLEMPWGLSTTTYTSNQSDGFGFLFDTAATTDTIRCVGVKADTDGTPVDTSLAPVAATYMTLRVECDTAGTARFYADGVLVGTITNAVTTTVALTPIIAAYSSATSSVVFTVDYWYTAMDR
jgi:hypothetical protein